jgi:hypothetical protein
MSYYLRSQANNKHFGKTRSTIDSINNLYPESNEKITNERTALILQLLNLNYNRTNVIRILTNTKQVE